MSIQQYLLAIITSCAFLSAAAQPLPLDPAVRTGKLANGFTYYIRHNETPQKRVLLYLVNKVGSVLEDEDQRGLAHFMEHMNFNGTTHFPKNELVDYLQKAGVRFGAELNAYTNFNETVYQLPLPTDDPTLVTRGVDIMRDWAHEALLDPVEIEKERGIVLEEERLGKGAKDRMSRQYLPVLFNRSRYAERLPIGLDNVLLHFKPATIRRFHQDWYRPDLQALIIVGDVDVNTMEQLVKAKFSDLKNPASARPRINYTVPLTGGTQFITVTDKENTSTTLEILIKHKTRPLQTAADYLEAIKRNLFNQLLSARRYAALSQEPTPAFTDASMSIQPLIGDVDMFAFEVTAKDGQLEKAFQQTWQVVEQVKRMGFTQAELDRVRQQYLRNMETALQEKDKTPSDKLLGEYQRLFLNGEAAPGISWEYNFTKAHIGAITLTDINKITAEYIRDDNRDLLVMAPEKDKASLPGQGAITAWIKALSKAPLAAYKDDVANQPLMAVKPPAGKVVNTTAIPAIGVTQLTLSNGVKVILKPTDFKNDEILFKAFAPGGTSLYANDEDYDNAASADKLIGSFGLGQLNPVQLSKVLNGKVLGVAPYITARAQGISGAASRADLETALQLTYLQFTSPRKDTVLYNNIINRSLSQLPNRYADPNNVFNDTMAYVMGGYNYRTAPPTLEKLHNITLDRSYDIYRERFADASNFTFVFVGNFTIDSIRPLLEQYLGALPATHKAEQALDPGVHVPGGQITRKVYKGKEDKALVRLVISGDYTYSPVNNLLLHALGQILQIKLLEQIREAEAEVYSPVVQTSYNKYPKNRFALIVAFGCAPGNANHLIEMVHHELDTLKLRGPDAIDVQKYKANYSKNVDLALRDNGFWLNYLASQYENREPVLEVLDNEKNLAQVTDSALKAAATIFLNNKNEIRFELLPEPGTTSDN